MAVQPSQPPTWNQGPMPPDPSTWRVSDQDRDAAAERVSTAFAEGRLSRDEFEQRLESALTARTRAELGAVLGGLYPPPPGPGWVRPPYAGVRPAGAGSHRPYAGQARYPAARASGSERCWAAAAHASGLVTSVLGPLVVLAGPGSRSRYVREQAVEALNIQISFIVLNVLLIAAIVFTLGLAALLYVPLVLAWPFVVGIAALAALVGAPVRYPYVLRLVR